MSFPKTAWRLFFAVALCALVLPALSQAAEETVAEGRAVSIEYTLTLDDGTVVDTNVGKAPLTYIQGASQIIPGLEKGLEGMKEGESRKVTVKPEEGYGEVNADAYQEVDKDRVPEGVEVGARLQGRDVAGRPVIATVKEVKENTVVLDYNHPLAGKTLHFDVKVKDIGDPRETLPKPHK
ncbi:MAG: peptidylprolyl isomerase [Thermodesulfovibrionales bacterium]